MTQFGWEWIAEIQQLCQHTGAFQVRQFSGAGAGTGGRKG